MTWTSCWTSPTRFSVSRSAPWAMVRRARSRRRSNSFATNTSLMSRAAAVRSTPSCPCSRRTEPHDPRRRRCKAKRREGAAPMTQVADTGEKVTEPELVTLTIDGTEISVPKGTLVIRAAELIGVQIPRFCDHPLLDPVGACRQCIVEIEGQRKPMASCTIPVADDMVVRPQFSSEVADKAQHGVMELLLINPPLDCPMCDKGGECPLQNQALANGQGESRFLEDKREFDKPVPISTGVLLDRERCISCTRCVRTSEEIAGDDFIEFLERGPRQYIGTAAGKPFNSYFSGNH